MGFAKRTSKGRKGTFTADQTKAATDYLTEWRKSAETGDALVFGEDDAVAFLANGGEDATKDRKALGERMARVVNGEATDEDRTKVNAVRSRITRALDVDNVAVIFGESDEDGVGWSFGVEATEPKGKGKASK